MKNIVSFFRDVAKKEHIRIAEIRLGAKSSLAGKMKIDVLRETGAVVLGLKQKGNRFKIVIPFKKRLSRGQVLLVMGTEKQLKAVENLARK